MPRTPMQSWRLGVIADVDHRIVEPGIVGERRADRRIGGQFDDAVMVVAELELARRAHHAVRFDAADRRDLELHAVGRDDRAGRAEHADQSGARIGRAAHDLQRHAVAGIDRQHLQLVGLRVALGGQHAARRVNPAKLLARIVDAFDLEPDARQRLDDRVEIGVGVEMLLEPAKRELHAPTPPLSVGTSSAEKP